MPLTNCPWVVRPKVLMANLGFEEVLLLNDFEAQALAAATLEASDRQKIGRGIERMLALGSRVVLGPGTGLGVAGLVHGAGHVVPGSGRRRPCGCRSRAARAITRSGRI